MDINKLTLESLKNYYKVLTKNGFLDYAQVYRLLVLVFITDFFTKECGEYVTEDDYNMIIDTIGCLSKNTCVIPYDRISTHIKPIKDFASYNNVFTHITPVNNYITDIPVRSSEDDTLMFSESEIIKLSDI